MTSAPSPPTGTHRPLLVRGATTLLAAGLALGLAACGSDAVRASTSSSSSATTTTDTGTPTSSPLPTGTPRPMGHIHGVGRDPDSGAVLLATHGGLFRMDPSGPTPVGPVVDLMGFAVAPDGSYLASGHPGTETDLPEPVGLIRSTDGGATWVSVSRPGQSDFHGLTAGEGLVAAYDGELRVGTDGSDWSTRDVPAAPHVLAASPSGDHLLATTRAGLLASRDAARTWTTVATPELLVVVAWADPETVVGVGVSGRLVLSEDSGRTWTTGTRAVGEVGALTGYRDGGGVTVVAVVGGEAVVSTTDLGETTTPLL